MAFAAEATERGSHFEEANRLYEQGKYADAARLYENMLQAGRNSVGVYFNLGNAYFKNGELGRAILNYRKAEALAPRDPDIQANLRFARERVSGTVSIRPAPWERLVGYFRLNELAGVAALLFWICTGLYVLAQVRPKFARSIRLPLIVGGSLFLVCAILLAAALYARNQKVVIVASRQVTARLGPLAESQPSFTATDGSELRLLSQREGWLQVSDRSGRGGWLTQKEGLIY